MRRARPRHAVQNCPASCRAVVPQNSSPLPNHAEDKTCRRLSLAHPVFSFASDAAQRALPAAQVRPGASWVGLWRRIAWHDRWQGRLCCTSLPREVMIAERGRHLAGGHLGGLLLLLLLQQPLLLSVLATIPICPAGQAGIWLLLLLHLLHLQPLLLSVPATTPTRPAGSGRHLAGGRLGGLRLPRGRHQERRGCGHLHGCVWSSFCCLLCGALLMPPAASKAGWMR